MDSIIGILSNKFDALPIGKQINLILVSDHGMISSIMSKGGYFRLFKAWLARICSNNNPVMSILARHDTQDSISKALSIYLLENR
jgi:alkaline phosphatase D